MLSFGLFKEQDEWLISLNGIIECHNCFLHFHTNVCVKLHTLSLSPSRALNNQAAQRGLSVPSFCFLAGLSGLASGSRRALGGGLGGWQLMTVLVLGVLISL